MRAIDLVMRGSGRRGLLVGVVVIAALGVVGALAQFQLDTSVQSFLPGNDPAVTAWKETEASFGGDPVAVIIDGQGGGDLLQPEPLRRLLALEGKLASLPDVAVVYGPGTVANQIVIQVNDLLLTIIGRRDALRTQAEADARAKGALPAAAAAAGEAAVAGFEARYGPLVVAGLPLGVPSVGNPRFIRTVFLDEAGAARPPLRWIVPDDSHVAIYVRPRENLDQHQVARLVKTVRREAEGAQVGKGLTVTGAPAVAASLGAEVQREVPRLGLAALLAVAVAFLLTYRVRGWRRLVPLVIGLAATAVTLGCLALIGVPFSLGILAFLPVMLGVGSDFPVQMSYPARQRTLLAAALASAAGFLGLFLSPLPFVRHLGAALAIGIVVSTGAGMAARRFGLLAAAGLDDRAGESEAPSVAGWSPAPLRRRWKIVVPAAVLAAVGWALLPTLPVEAQPERLAAGLPALGDAREAERVVGASGEVAVRVRAQDVLRPDLLAWFRQAEEELVLRYGDRLRPIVSPTRLLAWLGPDATPDQIEAALRILPRYLVGASVRSDRKEAVASFGIRLGDLGRQRELLAGLKAALPPAPQGVTIDVTGLPVVGSRGYELISERRVAASLAGPVLAGMVLLLLLRPRRDGLIAVAAALLAVGWGVAVLKLTGTGLSPLTVGLGSLTAAVGAEFCVFAGERARFGRAEPWAGAVAAAATSAAGFTALGLSRLAVLRQFGLVLAGSILLALLAARMMIGRGGKKEAIRAEAVEPSVPVRAGAGG